MRVEEFSKNMLDLNDKIRFAGAMEKSDIYTQVVQKKDLKNILREKIRKLVFLRLRILLK
ncbi:MAG: hypothetical protein WCF23_15285 [Candidatus Nitrosopolaris sp.]